MSRNTTAVFFLTSASLLAQPPRYTIHDLGALNNGAVTGINAGGQVIGYETQSDGHVRSFRTAPNAAINWATDTLGALGGTITRARGINASGQVAGESTLTTGELRAFRTAANTSIQSATDNLGTLGGPESQAYAINDSGRVTGSSKITSAGTHAFLTDPNSAIKLADDMNLKYGQFDTDSKGLYINNGGDVLAELTGYPVYPTAYLHTGTTSARLDVIAYIWQGYAGLTEQDQVVFNVGNDLQVLDGGKKTILTSCSTPCVPLAVNNSMQVVGSTANNQFLYTNGAVYDLATLLPAGSGWTMPNTASGPSPLFINDSGQIVGVATLNNGTHAFRLDPAPTVSTQITRTLGLLSSLHPGRRNALSLMMLKASLASTLNSALASWSRSNSSATRGLLNEFETSVRAQSGQLLTTDQVNQLIESAEAAFALT